MSAQSKVDSPPSYTSILTAAAALSCLVGMVGVGINLWEEPIARSFLLATSGFFLLSLPPFLLFGLLPYGVLRMRTWLLRRRYRGNAETLSVPSGLSSVFLRLYPALLSISLFVFFGWYFFINPLPSDDEMIAHFHQHRMEMEAIVKDFRHSSPVDTRGIIWRKKPEIKRLMNQAGIKDVNTTYRIWYPNPYSIDGARAYAQIPAIEKMPTLVRKLASLQLQLSDPRYWRKDYRYLTSVAITKSYMHIPTIPKIENDQLIFPLAGYGKSPTARVLKSLDGAYPFNWRRGECLYRPLTEHWFMAICRSY